MSPRDEKLDLLKSIPLFAGFGKRELVRLGMLTDFIDRPAGRVLMRQGEPGAEMFVIVRGRAEVKRDGRVIAEATDGEILGEIALVDEGPRSATVTLTEPSRLLVVGHREFHALMDEMPTVRLQVLEALARRVRHLEPERPH
ncbi:MAG: cyclic nucleotide-binding domain-containing protein [Chloroflexi bacterium]|nr:cyclic nucleotide-binding domain-containing protein [Chloroflexota bacterium]